MSYEMSCARCEGRLIVEELGVVVACPHCGTHLAIPTEIPLVEADESPSSLFKFSVNQGRASDSNILVSEPELQTGSEVPSAVRVHDPDPSAVVPAIVTDAKVSEPISSFPVIDGSASPSPDTKTDQDESSDAEPAEKFPVVDGGAHRSEPDSAPNIVTGDSSDEAAKVSAASGDVKVDRDESSQTSVYDAVYSSRRGKIVPNPVFQAWLSYTILVSAGLALAIYYIFTTPTSNLESLPDVKPLENTRKLVPEKAVMPRGHTLALNETQRFGNIEVTPLKVTKGDLTLIGRSYVDDSRKTQSAGTVLKLWLRFKNVSRDQTIAPLDNDLLFYRDPRSDRKAGALANNFVCRATDKREQGDLVLVYDHWVEGDYDIESAPIGEELKPGEEVTIFIPTEPEGWSQLQGPLVWRVHIRKGYSPQNYGVTTVFEVEFDSDAIEPDSASA